jgi:hypothetical protein
VKLHAWYDFFFKVRTQNSKGSVCPVDCVRIELQVCTFDSYLIPLSVRREIQGVGIVSAARAPHQRLSFRRAWNRGARITSRRRGGGSSYRETGSASAARTAADRSAVLGGSDGGSPQPVWLAPSGGVPRRQENHVGLADFHSWFLLYFPSSPRCNACSDVRAIRNHLHEKCILTS